VAGGRQKRRAAGAAASRDSPARAAARPRADEPHHQLASQAPAVAAGEEARDADAIGRIFRDRSAAFTESMYWCGIDDYGLRSSLKRQIARFLNNQKYAKAYQCPK
jgi:hypothetical protein